LSGQQIGTVLGGAVGAFFGGPAGAQIGMAIGGLVGGIVDPTKIDGPKIGQGQQQTSTDGAPIAWVLGTARIAGTLVQVSPRRDVKVHDSGKGGPSVSHHEAHQDFCIQVCESSSTRNSVMSKVIMVEQDGKIVYDARSGQAIGQGVVLPDNYVFNVAKAIIGFQRWADNVTFQYGPETQLPHPTLEAITGVGNCPSYRGTLTMVATDFNVTAVGDRVPSYVFTVASAFTPTELGTNPVTPIATSSIGPAPWPAYPDNAFVTRLGVPFNYGGDPMPATVTVAQFFGTIDPTRYGTTPVRYVMRNGAGGPVLFDSGWLCDADTYSRFLLPYYASDNTHPGPRPTIDSARYGDPPPVETIYFSPTQFQPGRILGSIPVGAGNTNLVCDTYFAGWWVPTPVTLPLLFLVVPPAGLGVTGDPGSLTLADAVTRICVRGGLTAADIDVTGLAGINVLGYAIATQCNGVAALTPLLQAYFCYGSEYDGKIHFKRLGADAVMTIDEDDLILNEDANDGSVVSTKRGQDTQYPAKITVAYVDPAQNYQPVTISESRLASNVNAIGEVTIPLSVTMGADEAKQAAQKAMKIAYAGLEGKQAYRLPFAGKGGVYLTLTTGDAVLFRGKRWGIDKATISHGYVELSTHYERQSAFTSTVQAVRGNLPSVPTSPYSGPTTLYAANLPSLRPQDTYGLYLFAASATGSTNWNGCVVQVSYDSQLTWVNATQATQASTLGTIVSNEPTGGEPLTVLVNGDLVTVTDAQLAVKANAFAILHASGAEIGQFKTATEDPTIANQYALTGVTRGLGTAQVPAAAGEQFTMLDSAYFLPIDPSFAGKTIYLRGVGFGETAESATIISIVYTALGPLRASNRVDADGNNRVDVDGNQRVTY
jgi:hypothetical protein